MTSFIFLNILFAVSLIYGEPPYHAPDHKNNAVPDLVLLLKQLAVDTDQQLLKMHFESLVTMIEDDTHDVDWTAEDSLQAAEVLKFFQNEGAQWETYANGPRPLMMSFKSPSDSKNTFYWLFLPKNFNPENTTYPFYMELHGSGGGKNDNPRRMLFHPLQPQIKGVTAQGYRGEGFFVYPWGRGDKWYQGQAETDIFECLEHFESMFKTDPARQYLYGFSMGGSGVYELAQKTSERWTAIGIYSSAFRDGVSLEEAAGLKDLPVWIAWGEEERLAENNRKLRDYLLQQENEVKWVEVKDVGHSYLGEYQEDLMDWFSAHEK
jgi:dipeptidyl aminopeptidase/acylaminoacyl peptidase